MDYETLSMKTLGDVGKAVSTSGLGVAGGFLGAGALGRYFQNKWVTDAEVTAAPTFQNMAYAWLGNNGPKLVAWYLAERYNAKTELTEDGAKGILGNVVVDTLMRFLNKGTNPMTGFIGTTQVLGGAGQPTGVSGMSGPDQQALIKENTELRQQIGNMQQQMAIAGIQPQALPTPAARRQRKYGSMEEPGTVTVEQTAAPQKPRSQRYAFMGSEVSDLTAMFGML